MMTGWTTLFTTINHGHPTCIVTLLLALPSLLRSQNIVPLMDCSCPRTFQPVCGTDQQTYDSRCFLDCGRRYDHELKLAYEGVCCPRAELCNDYVDPVCDQFGNRYDNDCIFEFHKCVKRRSGQQQLLRIEGRGDGMCQGKQRVSVSNNNNNRNNVPNPNNRNNNNNNNNINNFCDFFCDEVVMPVCDSQGRTHQNRCKFELARCRLNARGVISALHVVMEGPCRLDDPHLGRSMPLRIMLAKNRERERQRAKSTTTTETPRKGSPALGAGTFRDQQNQKQPSSQEGIQPEQNRKGQQQPPRKHHRPSSMADCDFCRDEGPFDQIIPVCDNTNLTHQSVCLFAQWSCEKRARGAEEHVLGHLGECSVVSPIFDLKDEPCPSKCSRHYKPVCDSTGMSHPNLCAYQMHSCHQRRNGRPFGWLLSLRDCPNGSSTTTATTTTTAKHESGKQKDSGKHDKPEIECPEEPNCDGSDQQDGAVCDSMGRMHKNTCEFAHAHCLAAKQGMLLRFMDDSHCEKQAQHRRATTPASTTTVSTRRTPIVTRQEAAAKANNNENAECQRKWALCKSKMGAKEEGEEDPHCGTDFNTYRNLCELQRSQCSTDSKLDILFKGSCERCLGRPCPTVSPSSAEDAHFVCDEGGETHSRCEFAMLQCIYEAKYGRNLSVAHEGKCCPNVEKCPLRPSSDAGDVCDSNGHRHRSRCMFEVAQCRTAKIAHQRLEERDCHEHGNATTTTRRTSTEATRHPDAAVESGMHSSAESSASSEDTDAAAVLAMPLRESEMNVSADLLSVEQLICSDKYEPVCGSDRRTYRNACQLERRNASADGPILRVLYPGECCPATECPAEYAPVCDSEGNTYLNLCEFGHQRCLAERTRAQNLTIAVYGLCPGLQCPQGPCPGLYEPVCATNGRTYASLCELDRTVCVLRSAGRGGDPGSNSVMAQMSMLGLDYIGECCETAVDCSDLPPASNGQPVCDSMGITHQDECEFRRAACQARRRREAFGLRMVRRGECARRMVMRRRSQRRWERKAGE